MPLTKGDDFPLHQTPDPIAFAGTDRNFYDRYFFNGYAPDGSGFFAAAFGVYPHLDVADAHLSFIRDGKQYSLHASIELGMERMALRCGPIAIEIIEPLNKLRIVVEETDGIAADITFTGRAFPIEEPRFTHRHGARAFMDYTRMTQNGHYEGWISLDSERQELASGTVGTRDRSWGIRPIGAKDPQPIPGAPAPAFFWQWTPLNLDNGSLFFHINADTGGHAWNTRAAWVADGGKAGDIVEGHGTLQSKLAPGTRWPASGSLQVDLDGAPGHLAFEPIQRFQMKGLGYTHPVWNHGLHHGPSKVERETYDLAGLDPADPTNLHVQILCRISGGAEGLGVFEQLILGPYIPLGLKVMFDGG